MNPLRQHISRVPRAGMAAGPGAFVLGVVLLLAGGALTTQSAEEPDDLTAVKLEYQVKAGFIYNFAKFVEWPPASPAPDTFRIAVLGDGPAFNVLSNELAGKIIGGKPVQVVLAQGKSLPDECRILFVARSQSARADEVRKQLGDAPVLTIGEFDQFAERGGCINFIRKGENIRFEINLSAAERARLKISSKLAAMARLVKPKEGDK